MQRVGTKCNGGMASSVHGLLECILWHGKLITKSIHQPVCERVKATCVVISNNSLNSCYAD